jgi:retron-type reverse transcriptase
LSGRKQCVKVKNICSSFETVYKGVPQGSILDPILFNIFINDIFYSVDFSTIYNYADNNTLSYADHDLKNVISKLESDSQKMLDWSKELQIFFTFTHCFLPDK